MPRDSALKVMREEASVGMWDARLIEMLVASIDDD
jgi:hypothetical protein